MPSKKRENGRARNILEAVKPSLAAANPTDFASSRMPLRGLDQPATEEVHVWALDLPGLAGSLRLAMDGDRAIQDAPFTSGQLRFARRFFLRLLLGAYLDLPGKSVHIIHGQRGKPVLDSARHPDTLHFSMAKSGRHLLIGISVTSPLGVDLEPAGRRAHNPLGVARRYFNAEEAAALSAMDGDRLEAAFLRAWACKEAVVKASGTGIANELCRFSVEIDTKRPPGMRQFDGDDPAAWSLVLLRPADEFIGALATRAAVGRVRAFRLLPAQPAGQ
jgi:4'-phosphopantetheinyl transferase